MTKILTLWEEINGSSNSFRKAETDTNELWKMGILFLRVFKSCANMADSATVKTLNMKN